jgi:hypothetical protein
MSEIWLAFALAFFMPKGIAMEKKTRVELISEFESLPASARINESMVAAVLGFSVAKLRKDRVFGSPIPFIKEGGKLTADKNGNLRHYGGRVFYTKQAVIGYMETKTQVTTARAAA